MSRSEKFTPIVEAFLKYFEQEAALINAEYHGKVSCRAYANFPPEDSPNHGSFTLFADCLLRGVAWDHCDGLAVGIEASDFDERVTINADLAWDVSPSIEFQVFDDPVELNDQSLTQIKEKLPYMFKKLRELLDLNPSGIPITVDPENW
jgi:hypothetical protein